MSNKLWIVIASLLVSFGVSATTPPTKEQIEQYKKEGTLQQRIEQAKALNNHNFNPSLVKHFTKHRLPALTGQPLSQAEAQQDPTPLDGYFPSTGTPKMLVLLVEFQDYQHAEVNSRDYIDSRIFGDGEVNEFPYDSQRSFYLRSSYSKLDIQGDVLEWYQTEYDRPLDEGNSFEVKQRVIKDAINYHDAQGHDFSQYDNDGDGDIDYVAVIWTGPTGAWASLWWGTFSGFGDDSYVIDGKTISTVSWQQVSYSQDEGPFSPSTLIHETGHALGLPDFYDYDDSIGPKGGLGGMDQMAGGHDHNSFSKFILGWLTPEVISGEAKELSLLPLSRNESSVLLKKDATESTKWDEFFIAEYRNQYSNDQGLPNEGLVIWHIDATLNEWGYFENNNSYSDHKLIRLVQADGLDEIELRNDSAGAEDFFTTGMEFSPNSRPQSRLNSGEHSGVEITDIVVSPELIDVTAQVFVSVPDFTVEGITDLSIARAGQTVSVNTSDTDIEKVEVFSADTLLKSMDEAPYEFTLNNELFAVGDHELRITVTNQQGGYSSERIRVLYLDGQRRNLLMNLSTETDEELKDVFNGSDLDVVETNFLVSLSSLDFPLVHISYGPNYPAWEYDSNGAKGSTSIAGFPLSQEINMINTYLESGGLLIVEGERMLSPLTELQTTLGVNSTHSDVITEKITGSNLYNEEELEVTVTEEFWPVRMDLIESTDSNETTVLLTATGQAYDFDSGQWLSTQGVCSLGKSLTGKNTKVIVSSCISRYLNQSAKVKVYNTYLDYLGISPSLVGNIAPTVDAGEDQQLNEGEEVSLAGTVVDPDSDQLTITWSQNSGTNVELADATSLALVFTAPEVSATEQLEFELTVSDGEYTATDTIVVTVNHVNKLPTISAGDDLSVDEGSVVNLVATATDADEDELVVSWQQVGGADVSLTFADTLNPSFVAPEVTVDISVEFELTVTDGQDTVTDNVVVTVKNVNKLPEISAGSDQSVTEGELVNLFATASDDDGDSLIISWQQLSGEAVTLTDATTLRPSFTAPQVTESQQLEFELTVTDGQSTVKDIVIVSVENANNQPTLSAGANQSVTEGASVTLTATAADADGDALTVNWAQTAGPQVTLSASDSLTPNFVAPQVTSTQTLTFEVTVSDGTASVSDTVSVTVQNSTSTDNSSSEGSSGGSTGGVFIILLSVLVVLRRQIALKH